MRTLSVGCALLLATCCGGCGAGPRPAPPSAADSNERTPPPPGAGDITRGEFDWPLPLQAAEDVLVKTELFEFGEMPQKRQVYAFNVVFDQPDALTRFHRIARDAGPAGKLYALCALQELHPPEAEILAKRLTQSAGEIMVGDHDAYRSQPIRDVVVLVLARRLGAEFRDSRGEIARAFRGPG